MSADQSTPPRHAAERLIVTLSASLFVLVLLAVVLGFLGAGRLRRHATVINEQTQRLSELQQRVAALERRLSRDEDDGPAADVGAPSAAPAPAPLLRPAPAVPPESQPLPASPGTGAALPESGAGARSTARLHELLRAAFEPDRVELADARSAEAALNLAHSIESLDAATLGRLAAAAYLLDREQEAESLASQAERAGAAPALFFEAVARKLLRDGRPLDALSMARRLAGAAPGAVSALLIARAEHELGAASAQDTLETLADSPRLAPADRVALGRLLVALDRHDLLAALLATFDSPAPDLVDDVNLLRAVRSLADGRVAEALAVLDSLMARRPDDYDVLTWRAAALAQAGQLQAARVGLEHAADQPQRPEAWYWRGVVEQRSGNPGVATEFFQHALAGSQRYAPAWEALAIQALNSGELAAAQESLRQALESQPRRASSHFLLALAHAKRGRFEEAREALEQGVALDPALSEWAQSAPALRPLIAHEGTGPGGETEQTIEIDPAAEEQR